MGSPGVDHRTDLPAGWLVSASYSLIHGADDHARAHGLAREDAGAMLATTIRSVFQAAPGQA